MFFEHTFQLVVELFVQFSSGLGASFLDNWKTDIRFEISAIKNPSSQSFSPIALIFQYRQQEEEEEEEEQQQQQQFQAPIDLLASLQIKIITLRNLRH